ncbi:hypothetical protein [Foetidibacter luteolus]|uniref:hypothetical protein n=1 Tax=Foetidibacter luteolus TaxID=2608880 RepID=UPI00129B3F37|nr:hypothetical protein [Foetidibacter luteolus]
MIDWIIFSLIALLIIVLVAAFTKRYHSGKGDGEKLSVFTLVMELAGGFLE